MSNPYEIDEGPTPPELPGSVVVRQLEEELHDALCADLFLHAGNCVREFGDFQLLVSPTRPVERLITRLMTDPHYRGWPWSRTRVWLADDDRDGSGRAGMADLLLDHAGLPEEQLHGFEDGAEAFERTFRETLAWREKGHDRPDVALLSLSAAGDLAGWTAGDEAPDEDRLALKLPGERFAVSPRLLNASRYLGVLAIGPEAEQGLGVFADSPPVRLSPVGGVLRWFVDYAACGRALDVGADQSPAEPGKGVP